MNLSSDQVVLWRMGFATLNLTIVTTWGLMAILTLGSYLITRRLVTDGPISRWQAALEFDRHDPYRPDRGVGLEQPRRYLVFLGSLFLFLATANVCTVIPGYQPPTGSLSTTAALALCVFVAVPFFGIREQGMPAYLKTYLQPTAIMLPFNIISELSRTLALAIRLFGNMMSGAMIIAILITITPLLFPDRHDRPRPAHGHGAGLYLHHSGGCLYRRCDRCATSESRTRHDRATAVRPLTATRERPWTAAQ